MRFCRLRPPCEGTLGFLRRGRRKTIGEGGHPCLKPRALNLCLPVVCDLRNVFFAFCVFWLGGGGGGDFAREAL